MTYLNFAAIFSLFGALYYQYVQHMEPCPWCILIRICLIMCIAGGILSRSKTTFLKVSGFFSSLLFSGLGLYSSITLHITSQLASSCSKSLASRFLEVTHLDQLAPFLFEVRGFCSDVAYVMGVPMYVYAAILFAGYISYVIYYLKTHLTK